MPNTSDIMVGFKRGLQKDLFKTTITEGTFYLTTDSNRLYVGQKNSEGKIVPIWLNSSIKIYKDINAAQNAGITGDGLDAKRNGVIQDGDFVFLTEYNALLIFKENEDWDKRTSSSSPNIRPFNYVYLNSDTDIDTMIDPDASFGTSSVVADGSEKNSLSVTLNLAQMRRSTTSNQEYTPIYKKDINGATVTDSNGIPEREYVNITFTIPAEQFSKLTTDAKVGLELNEDKTTIVANGPGSNNESAIKVIGSNGIKINTYKKTENNEASDTVKYESDTLEIAGPTISAQSADGTNEAAIVLMDSDNVISEKNKVYLAGSDKIALSYNNINNKNKISIAHKTIKNKDNQLLDKEGNIQTNTEGAPVSFVVSKSTLKANSNDSIEILDDINVDESGHVTQIAKKKVKLPSSDYTLTNFITKGSGGLAISLANDNEIVGSASLPEDSLFYKIGETKYVNGTTLPVYTKTDIDSKLQNLNGLLYKGVWDNQTKIEELTIQNGDMWKAKENISITLRKGKDNETTINAQAGDLIIAQGTEENGIISVNNVTFDVVPSGDDIDTQYYFKLNGSNVIDFQTKNGDLLQNRFFINTAKTDAFLNTDLASSIEYQEDKKQFNINIHHNDYKPKEIQEDIFEHQFDVYSATELITDINTKNNDSSSVDISQPLTYISDLKFYNGHLIGYKTATRTFAADKLKTVDSNKEGKLYTQSGSTGIQSTESISFTGDAYLIPSSSESPQTINYSHITQNSGTGPLKKDNKQTLSLNTAIPATFGAITGISYDTAGHLTDYTVTTYTMPNDVYFERTASISGNNYSVTANLYDATQQMLKNGVNHISNWNITSNTLSLSASGSNNDTLTVDLKWGTF